MRRPSNSDPEPIATPAPDPGYIRRPTPERLEYEGPIVVSVEGHGCAYLALVDTPGQGSDDLAELTYELIDPPLEGGYRPDLNLYARIVVEILPDPRPEVLP